MVTNSFQVLSAAVLGLGAHWGFFIHGEKDLKAANIARFHLLLAIGLIYFIHSSDRVPFQGTRFQCLKIGMAYATSLFTSIIIYRLFLCPLCHIPGPLHMSITKLAHVFSQANYRNSEVLHALHKARGDIVRTGSDVCLFKILGFKLNYNVSRSQRSHIIWLGCISVGPWPRFHLWSVSLL